MRLLLFCLLALCGGRQLPGQAYTTHTYYTDDTTELSLDLFLPETPPGTVTPLVIYVHGGGFSGGDRSEGHALGNFLKSKGIACASISYTLSMQGRTQDWSCDGILTEKIKTIQLAANQTWLATRFLLGQVAAWKLDAQQIFLAGTSAGGEAILHAAYWDRKQMALYQEGLPAGFRYRGLISGAGAIMDLNLITADNHLPTFFIHGDADPVVPYGTAAHHYCPPNASGWLMLFGSQSIARHLEALGENHLTISFDGAGHEVCGHYFHQEQQVIVDFIERVGRGRRFREWVLR